MIYLDINTCKYCYYLPQWFIIDHLNNYIAQQSIYRSMLRFNLERYNRIRIHKNLMSFYYFRVKDVALCICYIGSCHPLLRAPTSSSNAACLCSREVLGLNTLGQLQTRSWYCPGVLCCPGPLVVPRIWLQMLSAAVVGVWRFQHWGHGQLLVEGCCKPWSFSDKNIFV